MPGAYECFLTAVHSHLRRTIAPSLRGGWAEDWLDDVVDECVLDVLRALHSCRARNEGQLLAWLAAIKRRQLALLFRRESRSDRVLYLPTETIDSRPFADWPAAILRELNNGIDELSEVQSRLLWMRFRLEATWREIAMELGVRPSAAKRRYQRLIASLRRRCEHIRTGDTRSGDLR